MLTNGADVIGIARATDINSLGKAVLNTPSGSVPAERYTSQLKIKRILKGKVGGSPLSVQFFLSDALVGTRGTAEGEYAVFFLKASATGFVFRDPVHPSLPAGQQLRGALAHPDPDRSLRIAITLVARGDIAGLDNVGSALMNSSGVPQELIEDAAGSLASMKDPNAIRSLSGLLSLNNPEINRGVAAALRQTGSASALLPLSRLLNDSDPMTRYYAVIGFGEITRQDQWAPGFSEFQQNPGRYVSYWRTWAEQNVH